MSDLSSHSCSASLNSPEGGRLLFCGCSANLTLLRGGVYLLFGGCSASADAKLINISTI